MTIKQQGGIFGRNPTFNDAEVDDLTVTGSSTLNGAFSVQGNIGKLNQTADGNLFQIANGLNTEAAVVHVGSGRSGDGNTYIDLFGASGATFGARLIRNGGTNGATLLQTKGTGNLTVRTDDAAPVVIQTGGAEAARFNTSGNLAFPSGQGIDFSATAGTGTSELFSDYEEGTWTPTYAPASGAFGSVTYDTAVTGGKYTKVGNLVHIQGGIRTDAITVGTASGGVRLSGLPFAAIANGTGQDGWSTLTVGQATAFAGDVPSTGSVVAEQSYIELQYRSAANGATIDLDVADLDTGADDNLMRFSATYIAG